MMECKSYLHAVYLLGFNRVYIEERTGKEVTKGVYTLAKEHNEDKLHDGIITVENTDGKLVAINYYNIASYEVKEILGVPLEKSTQAKLKEKTNLLITDNIGINKNINISMADVSKLLDNNVMEIYFTKVDGALRRMLGTINDWRLGEDSTKEYFMGVDKEKERYGNMVVYDLEKHEYRTIRYLSILSIEKVKN